MKSKSNLPRLIVALFPLLALTGCELRQQMYDNGRIKPMQRSDFFADGRSNRPQVEGTVARGHLDEDDATFRGQVNGNDVSYFPIPIDAKTLARGRERFNIHCAVCHGPAGYADGMVVQRGFKKPTSYHDARLRAAPPGYFFGVITNGFGAMPRYPEIKVNDRWAIVAYVKALQLSQNATLADVPEADKAKLDGGAGKTKAEGAHE